MKLFITGSTGYLGHQFTLAAAKKGYFINALIRNENDPNRPLHPNIRFYNGDITDFESVAEAIKGCDVVFHFAALTQLWNKDRSLFYKINVGGTRNVLEAAAHHGVKKLVYTSTCAVYGPSFTKPISEDDPRLTAFENDYEISKHCAEELVKEFSRKGLFTVIVCPPRLYGPGIETQGNPINALIKKIIRKKLAAVPGAKEVVGNYAFIDDVVEGHFLAMEKGLGGEKYILGGENVSYGKFFTTIKECEQNTIKLITIPKFLLKVWAAFVYIIHLLIKKHTHISPSLIERLFQNRAVSCAKAQRQLGYQITPFIQGIYQTIQYLKTKK